MLILPKKIHYFKFRLEKLAEANKKKVILEAQAEEEAIRLKAEAEAVAILAKGEADAKQMSKKAEAWSQYKDAAVLDMIIQVLPKV